MGTLWSDIRYAVRLLRKSPGFTSVVVVILAVGVGADTALFHAVDQMLLRPLPVERPHGLVQLECRWVDEDDGELLTDRTFNYPLYESYAQSGVFVSLVAFHDWTMKLAVHDVEHQLQGMAVSSNYFAVLGIQPALGSLAFPADDPSAPSESVAVISDGLWRRQFGGDPKIIGTQVLVDNRPAVITGVAPRGFTGTVAGCTPDIYVPLGTWAAAAHHALGDRSSANWYLLGRLKPGLSRGQAQAALRVLAAQIVQVEPNNTHTEVFVTDGSRGPLNPQRQQGRMPLLLLIVAASFVLLIACANVANMQLVRALTRQKEIALRQALGASRGRIIRQLLVESLVLALMGGAGGLLLAVWLDRLLCGVMATISSVHILPGLNARILLFALALSLATGILFGLAPALRAMPGVTPIFPRGPGWTGPVVTRGKAHALLVVVQMACSMMVLVCASLCLYSLVKVKWLDPGFDPARILAISVDYQQEQGRTFTRPFLEELGQRAAQLPGVESTSLANKIPLEGGETMSGVMRLDGRELSGGEQIILHRAFVSPGFFHTLGLPLLRGRDIADNDVPGSGPVMVINEIAARRCWPGQDPLGKHLTFFGSGPQGESLEVVGVVKAAKDGALRDDLQPIVYQPLAQVADDRPVLLVRAADHPRRVADKLRTIAASSGMPASACDVRTIAQRQWRLFHPQRILSGIVNAFGAVVLILCTTGIYGVTAYAIRQRTREIGIRIAMGARRQDILALVLRQGAMLTMAGLTLGIGLSLLAMRLLEASLPGLHAWNPNFLLGVTPRAPLPYAGAALLLALAAFTACYLPARRAARVNPMVALREE